MNDNVEVTHNAEKRRYELRVEGELASIAEYASNERVLVFDHTETSGNFRGRGLARRLVETALDDVRKRDLKVVPSCWFVAGFIQDHPEYQDLVAHLAQKEEGPGL